MDCEILIPPRWKARSPGQRGRDQGQMVIEAPTAPTTPDADDILHDKGVLVLPT